MNLILLCSAPLPTESDAESVAEEIPHKAEPAKAESADTKMKDEEEEEEDEEDGEEVSVPAQNTPRVKL